VLCYYILVRNSLLIVLPAECYTYTNNSDSTRRITYTAVQTYCDSSLTPGWYRFVGAAGTGLSTTYVGSPGCGSRNTGFIGSGKFTNLTSTSRTAVLGYCFNQYMVNSCTFKQNISVTFCDNYYVFYISPQATAVCPYRYCTE